MTFDIALTLAVLLGSILALMFVRAAAELILFGGLAVLFVAGVVEPDKACAAGFGNKALVTIGALFVVAEGLRQTGAVDFLVKQILGRPRTAFQAQAILMFPVAILSAFINNTPVVAMMLPVVDDWARQSRISVSKLLLPLSFATILGGMITTIGTSTTLIVNAELEKQLGPEHALQLFDLAWVGIPVTLMGILYLLVTSPWLLPDRKSVMTQLEDPREYTVEMLVDPNSPLVGKTIEKAGLRSLPGAYLVEVERESEILAAVGPQLKIHANDRLIFVGVVESVVDLQKIPGLKPATNQVFKLNSPRTERCLIEAVVSSSCPVVNLTIRESKFRTRYNAAVIAVSRNGERLRGKIGDIQLLVGDTLLVEAHPDFAEVNRNSRDFYLVSTVDNSTPLRHDRAWLAQLIMLGMIGLATFSNLGMLKSALMASSLMLVGRCVRGADVKRSIDWSVLMTIGVGLALGEAVRESGTADYIATSMIGLAGDRPLTVMALLLGLTMVLTNLITAKAAAVLILPIAIAAAGDLSLQGQVGLDPTPFVVAVMIGAAASFATPIGFQTNLMVAGPGGYRYADFARIGIPLSLLVWAMSVALIAWRWPFSVNVG